MRSITLLAALAAMAFATPASSQQQQMPRGKPTLIIAPSEISGVPGHELRAITNDFVAGAGTRAMSIPATNGPSCRPAK